MQKHLRKANSLLWLDTSLISSLYYVRHYYVTGHPWVDMQNQPKLCAETQTCIRIFIAALFTASKSQNIPNICKSQTKHGMHVHTVEYDSVIEEMQ